MTDSGRRLRSHRPALEGLHRDQKESLASFRDGFDSRRDLLWWSHDFQYLSLGRVKDGFYFGVATRPTLLAVALTGPRREELRPDVDLDVAESERRRLVSAYLRPACEAAFRDLRDRATEYLDEERPDSAAIATVAARPALEEHQKLQEKRIESFLDGFDDLADVEEWLHDLDMALFGSMLAVEPNFDHKLLSGVVERRVVLEDDERYKRERERWVARYLLPACNVSVRKLVASAGESAETESSVDHSPMPYE